MDFYTCGATTGTFGLLELVVLFLINFACLFVGHSSKAFFHGLHQNITKNLFWCWCCSKKHFLTFLCFGHSKQTLSRLIPGSSCLITHTYVYPWIIQFTYVPFANLRKEEEWHLTIFSIWMPTLRNATRVTLTGTYYWVVWERYVFKL